MTNATVSESVVGNDGHTLLVKYKDGEKKVFVADNTPVVTFVPGDKSELKAGAKVDRLHEAAAGRLVRNQPRQCRPRRPDTADVMDVIEESNSGDRVALINRPTALEARPCLSEQLDAAPLRPHSQLAS